jgi:hypothetical protein
MFCDFSAPAGRDHKNRKTTFREELGDNEDEMPKTTETISPDYPKNRCDNFGLALQITIAATFSFPDQCESVQIS